MTCIIIPGGVIACRDADKHKFECVQYGAIIAAQSEFYCEPDADNSINDSLFDSRTDSVKSPVVNPNTRAKEANKGNEFTRRKSTQVKENNDLIDIF